MVMISSRNIILREWTSSIGTGKIQATAGNSNRRRAMIIIIVIKNRNIYWLSVNFMGDTSAACY
jgi:hypothetical protein